MALYAIGDLHLSFGADKPMDVFGGKWENYIEKLTNGFSVLGDDDVCVLCGDLTWGMSIESCVEDFRYINALPGRKIVLKGNHDFWWSTATKATRFFADNGFDTIDILFNNCFFYGETAICGTRGWFYEPNVHTEHDKKIMEREVHRLEASLASAGDAPEKLCFFHYPPRYGSFISNEMINVMYKYGVNSCWYGHIHGKGQKIAVNGNVGGINYSMISADYVDFKPVLIKK